MNNNIRTIATRNNDSESDFGPLIDNHQQNQNSQIQLTPYDALDRHSQASGPINYER